MSAAAAMERHGGAGELTGPRKVAVLLTALGEEASARVVEELSPAEVEAISLEIARMDPVDPALVEAVLREWQHSDADTLPMAVGGVDYARRIVERALGMDEAPDVMRRIEEQLEGRVPLTHLRGADPQQLYQVIRDEHPQTIALILASLEPEQAAGMLRGLDPERGSDLILRMARMERVLPEVLQLIESSLGSDPDLAFAPQGPPRGGPASVAEVLKRIPGAGDRELLEAAARVDPESSERIRNLMFVFEDIGRLDDRSITRILRDVDTRQLAVALKVTSPTFRDRLLGVLSTRARDSLLQEMEFLGPVRVREVEAAQTEVVRLVRVLEEAGEITVESGDDVVVA